MEIAGILIGVFGVVLAVIFYNSQKKSQEKMDKFVSDALAQLKGYEQTSFDLLVGLRNENLRLFMKHFDDDECGYWHFKWRFETWDSLGLTVYINEEDTFYLKIRISGTTDDFRKNPFDGEHEYFLCEVSESSNESLFNVGDKISCFYSNRTKYISKYIGRVIEPEDKFKFTIGGLGNMRFGSGGDISASEVESAMRAKDFRI